MNYADLLARKLPRAQERGIALDAGRLLPSLFDYQAHCTEFALRVGSTGIYLDTGLGKTAIELAFGSAVLRHGGASRVLMLTPLAVAQQAKREADKLGVDDVRVIRDQRDAATGINICNYDRILSGAIDAGRWLVAHRVPGTSTWAVDIDCPTQATAAAALARLVIDRLRTHRTPA